MHVSAVLNIFYVKNMRRSSYTPEGYYWQLEYRDTVKLLQEKILLFLRLNDKLRNNIRDKNRFINNTPEAIEINLMEFSEAYRQKFIEPDLEVYILRFIDLLVPVLKGFLKEVGYDAYSFKFVFRCKGKIIEKYKSILGTNSEGISNEECSKV
ncbi:hypothetical protein D3C86_1633000 [compost metagenome]